VLWLCLLLFTNVVTILGYPQIPDLKQYATKTGNNNIVNTGMNIIYWTLKLTYIAIAFVISIGITTIYEEWIISRMHKPQVGKPHYFMSVFSANLMAFLLSGGIAAVYMLPKRLASPSFLVEVLRHLVGVDV